MTASALVMPVQSQRPRSQALELLGNLLTELEVPVSRLSLQAEGDSLAALCRCARRHGVRARVLSVGPAQVRSLNLALIRLEDGRYLAWDRARASLLSGDGTRLPVRLLPQLAVREALALEPKWLTSGGLLVRLAHAIWHEASARGALAVLVPTLLISAALGFVQPALIGTVIDRAIPEGAAQTLFALLLALFIAMASETLAGSLAERAALFLEVKLAALAHPGLLAHYLALPLRRLMQFRAGDVIQTQRGIPGVVHGAIYETTHGLVDVLLAAGYLFWIGKAMPWWSTAILVTHIAIAAVSFALGLRTAQHQERALDSAAEQSNLLLELVERVAVFRAEGATDWGIARWLRELVGGQTHELKLDALATLIGELNGFVQRVAVGVTVLVSAGAALAGELSLGQVVALTAASGAASGALSRLTGRAGGLITTHQQLRRIDRVLAEPVATAPTAMPPLGAAGIVCEDVWFRYGPDLAWVLQHFSIRFEPGRIHTIRWPSGTGKSTLLRLIAGLDQPERGNLSVLGLDPRRAKAFVRYVPQGCPLFQGSVLYNLRLLSGCHDQARLLEAARLTGLVAIVDNWPMGFETLIAGGGANISSGQRQLVVLTAALASPQPVLLLDEATKHLDAGLRAGLNHSPLLHGRTILNVVHTLDSTAADQH